MFCVNFDTSLVFHSVGHLIFNQNDRIMIQKILGETQVGVYSVAYMLISVLVIIYGALNIAWIPFYFEYKRKNCLLEINQHSKRYINLFLVITLGFLCLSPEVFKLLAPSEYWSGITLIPIFVLSTWFAFLYLFPVNHEFFYKKTKLIPVMTLTAAGTNIIFNLFLIPRYGILGAALGTLIAHIAVFVLHDIVARFVVQNYEYSFNIYILPTVITLIACVSFYFLREYIYTFFNCIYSICNTT